MINDDDDDDDIAGRRLADGHSTAVPLYRSQSDDVQVPLWRHDSWRLDADRRRRSLRWRRLRDCLRLAIDAISRRTTPVAWRRWLSMGWHQQLAAYFSKSQHLFSFYRASICEGGLGSRNSVHLSVCLSVSPSVCLSHACIVTKLNDALQIFFTTRKGNHSVTLIPRVVGRRRPLPSEICVRSDSPPSKNADFHRFLLITSQP